MTPKIRVFHINHGLQPGYDLHLYCGRPKSFYPEGLINADLGNPFPMRDESERDRVCNLHANWLAHDRPGKTWKTIERIALRVQEGKSVALYCFCAPKRCHCDTIRAAIMSVLDGVRFCPSPQP